jgi:hypothetical protein
VNLSPERSLVNVRKQELNLLHWKATEMHALKLAYVNGWQNRVRSAGNRHLREFYTRLIISHVLIWSRCMSRYARACDLPNIDPYVR